MGPWGHKESDKTEQLIYTQASREIWVVSDQATKSL